MSLHSQLADVIDDADGGSMLTLQPLFPDLTTKQLTNALQQARRCGLIHKVGHEFVTGTRSTKIALYKPGPEPSAPPPSRRPVASVWEWGQAQ